jgi:hypothetical protein
MAHFRKQNLLFMKRNLLLAFILTSIAFVGNAQISKGSVMLGGGLGYQHASNNSRYK